MTWQSNPPKKTYRRHINASCQIWRSCWFGAEPLTDSERSPRRSNQRLSSGLPQSDTQTSSSSKKKKKKKNVNGHVQLCLKLDGDEILLLVYLVGPRSCLHQFISAIDFCHSHGKIPPLDTANVNLIITYIRLSQFYYVCVLVSCKYINIGIIGCL
uniref:Uncharacterized protein n=1 Tax=Noccaea caerulescens TaxID=107243 RepID=A0A1J3HP89_NOCCA